MPVISGSLQLENLGKYFLELRLQREYSYQDIWNELRIPENQIKAIEENPFTELGVPYGVAKTLVYNYARFLEADVDAVMHTFQFNAESAKPEFQPATPVKENKIMLSPTCG